MLDFKIVKEDKRFQEIQARMKELHEEQEKLFNELEERWPIGPYRSWCLYCDGSVRPSTLISIE